jgi:hypothetical protein
MLRQILNLFSERKIISLTDLVNHFNTDNSAMTGMLEHLVRKKFIKHLHIECIACSSNCKTCNYADEKEYYEILEKTQ